MELVPLLPSERVGQLTYAINYPLPVNPTWPILPGTAADENWRSSEESRAPINAQVGSLPPQPTVLIGRAEDLQTARGQVLAADVRLLTLVGPGGG